MLSTGNGFDFGDLTQTSGYNGITGNQTRAIRLGGTAPVNPSTNVMDYVTITNQANAVDFGDCSAGGAQSPNINSPTRGVFAVAYGSQIDYVTIPTLGNAQDFGTSSPTRAVWFGGLAPSGVNTIQYVTIATTGDAVDFGDCVDAVYEGGACSTGHGGLG
jgi:hypothetical protein